MAAAFTGEWTLDHNENFDAFLKTVGMNAVKRAMVVKLGGGITLTMNGDSKINIKTVNGPKTRVKDAPIGVEFDDEDMDGAPIKGTFTIENGKLIGNFTTKKGKNLRITREVDNGMLVQTMEFEGTTCKRIYKKK